VIASSSLAKGDLAAVPPGLPHAFAAARGSDADLLIVITPVLRDFEHFRHPARITTGQQPPRSLLEVQAPYGTFFDDGPAWRPTRGGDGPGS
jgi:hypothetical protein